VVKPPSSENATPLEKWRLRKDKVLEADSVESEELPAYTPSASKSPPLFSKDSSPFQGRSGDLTYVPIQPPPSKGEATMMPIQAPPSKGEATMLAGESRGRKSAEATMLPGKSRRRKSAAPIIMPGTSHRRKSGEATMLAGTSHRKSSEATMVPTQRPPSKGEATMLPGESRRKSAEPTMLATQTPPSKGEATMVPTQALPSKGEATMLAGESHRKSSEATMVPTQTLPSKGEATMLPGESRRSSSEATMLAGESRRKSADPTMLPGESRRRSSEATMLAGESRRPSTEATMVPIQAPPSKGEATMVPFTHSRARTPGFYPKPGPKAPAMQTPKPSYESPSQGLTRDKGAIPEATVNGFIDELRSLAFAQGMGFSIIQPDGMKCDFFTESKALRVSFSGLEHAVDRIVVREISPSAEAQAQDAASGSARKRMLEWEVAKNDARKIRTLLDVATTRDAKGGVFDWTETPAPAPAPAKTKPSAPSGRTALEAHYFDAEDGRNWLVELIDRTPPADQAPGRALTPEGAKRLVMLLLNCLRSVGRGKPSV